MLKKLLVGLVLTVFLVAGVATPLLAAPSFLWEAEGIDTEHNSHSHTFDFTCSNPSHDHDYDIFGPFSNTTHDSCGDGLDGHSHYLNLASNSGASHSSSGSTGSISASDLNHTHTISGALTSAGSHTHSLTSTRELHSNECNAAGCDPEDQHSHSTSGTYASSGSHTHTFTGETGTGVGTLASHTHSIDLTSVSNGSHTHTKGSAALSDTTTCHRGNDHGHNVVTSISYGTSHDHGIVEDTALAGETPPTVTTQAVSAITDTTATGNGNITDIGSENATKRGIVYGTTSKGDPGAAAPPGGYDAYEEQAGSFGTGAFTRSLTSLTPGQIYYARAYAYNVAGYNYGGEVNFYTLPSDPSSLSATTISDTQIDLTWTKGTGGDKTMVRRKEGSYPANEADGDQAYFDTGVAHSDVGRDPGTFYYYRAWAYDTEGTQYSSGYSSDTAKTYGPPELTTNAATLVEETTATLNGEITAINGANATTRGFEWDIDQVGGYANDWHEDGDFGVEAFPRALSSLTKGDKYYFRVYATNTYGTGYGAEQNFLMKPDPPNTFVAVTFNSTQIDFTWNKGTGATKTYIRGEDGSYPTDRTDGHLVYDDTGTSTSDTELTGGHTYYYKAWGHAEGSDSYSDLYDFGFAYTPTTLKLWFEPNTMIIGVAVVDRSISGNPGTIHWGANPGGVEITVGGLVPYSAYTAPAGEEADIPVVLPEPTGLELFEDPGVDVTGWLGYGVVNRMSESVGWSVRTGYSVLMLLAATAFGFAAMLAVGTIWGFVIGFGITAATAGGMGVLPYWVAIIVVLFVIFGGYVWARS